VDQVVQPRAGGLEDMEKLIGQATAAVEDANARHANGMTSGTGVLHVNGANGSSGNGSTEYKATAVAPAAAEPSSIDGAEAAGASAAARVGPEAEAPAAISADGGEEVAAVAPAAAEPSSIDGAEAAGAPAAARVDPEAEAPVAISADGGEEAVAEALAAAEPSSIDGAEAVPEAEAPVAISSDGGEEAEAVAPAAAEPSSFYEAEAVSEADAPAAISADGGEEASAEAPAAAEPSNFDSVTTPSAGDAEVEAGGVRSAETALVQEAAQLLLNPQGFNDMDTSTLPTSIRDIFKKDDRKGELETRIASFVEESVKSLQNESEGSRTLWMGQQMDEFIESLKLRKVQIKRLRDPLEGEIRSRLPTVAEAIPEEPENEYESDYLEDDEWD